MSALSLPRRTIVATARSLPPVQPSTQKCGFCTSIHLLKDKGKGRAHSSNSSSRRSDPLASLIGLYHSTTSGPAVGDTQALNHYIDQKLLSKTPVRPQDLTVVAAEGSKANPHARQGPLLFSPTNEKGSIEDRYAYMEEPIVLEGTEPAKAGSSLSGLAEDFEAERGNPIRMPSTTDWKPIRSRAPKLHQQRARQVLDALAGTINGKYAGPELVKEAYEAFGQQSGYKNSTS